MESTTLGPYSQGVGTYTGADTQVHAYAFFAPKPRASKAVEDERRDANGLKQLG